MKIAFDEHVPSAMARAFEGFAEARQFRTLLSGIEIVKAADYAPGKQDDDFVLGSDVPWIRRFSQDGGRFIVSGDTKMLFRPHERLALVEAGMTVFFFGSQWSNWKFFRKCALLMCCWPLIADKVRKSKGNKAAFWRIPTSWADDAKLQRLSTKDQRLVKLEKQLAARAPPKRGKKKRRPPIPDQGELFDGRQKQTKSKLAARLGK